MAEKRKRKKVVSKEANELRQELLTEIGALRGLFREIVERYQTNVEADLVSCINVLSIMNEQNGDDSELDEQVLKLLLQAIRKLKLKPKKGRFKDIRKIDDVTMLLYAKLVEQE